MYMYMHVLVNPTRSIFILNHNAVDGSYWLDPERKKDSVKAFYDQNRELSKQAQYHANPKEKKSYEVGYLYLLGAICPSLFTRKGRYRTFWR